VRNRFKEGESKMSQNTKTIPVNQEGALELGLCPCGSCGMGWGSWSVNETKTCMDNCSFYKRWLGKIEGFKIRRK